MRNTRESGVPWLPEVPQHWEISRLKFEATHIVDCLHATPPYDPEGEFPAIRTADVEPGRLLLHQANRLTAENYLRWTERLVPVEGDILYTREGERFGIAASVPSGVRLCISQRMMLFRIRPDRDSAYFMWQLNARHVYEQAAEDQVGAAAPHVNVEKIQNFRLLVPPLDEQRDIVHRIVRETSRIDALVAAKQRLLDLLAEKRKAIIATAVTRGLDPKVKLRDSGVPWLGEIPAHWQIERARWLFRERDERGEPDLPLMEVSIANGVSVREFSDERIETTAADFNSYKVARKNDIAFNKMRMWQGAVGVAPTDGLVSPDYVVAEPNGSMLPDYSGLLFRIEALSAECGRRSHGLTWDRLRIYWDEFREIQLPLPAAAEQQAIVEHITRETAKLDAVRAATERTIALLKERRYALIAAAVTGQLDVEAAA